ncbi:MAG: DUF885 domain-containing protein, partial [Bdellovibrionia bacterium]
MKYLALILALSFSAGARATITCANFKTVTANGAPADQLKKFLDLEWKYSMVTYPEFATYVGYPGQNDRWTDRSLSAIAEQHKMTECLHGVLKKINPKGLGETDRLNYDLSLRNHELSVEGLKYPSEYLAIDQLGGVHMDIPDMLVGQVEALLRAGHKKKLTAVKQFLQKVPGQFDTVLTEKGIDSPLYAPFKEINIAIPEIQKAAFRAKALTTIESEIYPAYKKLKKFLVDEYIPAAREKIAWKDMPDGENWYNFLINVHTTTRATSEELHQLGLKEVARIQNEMTKTKELAGFKGDLKAFNKFLLEDSKFYYKTGEELLAGYRDIAKRLDSELPKIFGKLPRLPYGVRAIPDYKAAASPTAYYMGGSLEGGRAGYFEANTHDLKSRPKWGMEVLTMHEAVPGHHLQIALSQEMEKLPEFRKHDSQTAYVEGWALYSESLGADLGMYKDVYSKYGQLTYEIMRAVRLVVDTGMHAKGWTREQSLKFFMDAMPTTKLEAEVEIDRYITWPGQALAYKVGQLKIRELRTSAEKE